MVQNAANPIPDATSFWIRKARVPSAFLPVFPADAASDRDGSLLLDLLVERGRIAAIQSASDDFAEVPTLDLQGRQLWPTLVDLHTHIDKSQVVPRIGLLGASFANARNAINADRAKYWNNDEIRERMEFSVRCAYVHGVSALRTHIDSYEGQAEASWAVFDTLREDWKGRVTLQATSSVPIDVYATDYGRRLADLAAATEGGLLGGVLRRSTDHNYSFIENIDDLLDAQFSLARARGLSVDLHVDETTEAEIFHLEHVAQATIRNQMQGRVICGHCCSLALQPETQIDRALALCAEAGIGIVTLPSANLYLQDRKLGRTPRLRAVPPVHEVRSHKIPVAIASDNVRDSFYPFGDYDMVENFRMSVSVYHLDQCLGEALDMIGPAPASLMGVEPLGSLSVGGPANFIIFKARSLGDIVCRPQSDRVVIVDGRLVSDELPAFPTLSENDQQPPNNEAGGISR